MTRGKHFQIAGAAATTEDSEHRHQQQEPLRKAHPAEVTRVRNGLEETDQVIRCGLINCGRAGFGKPQRAGMRLRERWEPPTKANVDRAAKKKSDRLFGGPFVLGHWSAFRRRWLLMRQTVGGDVGIKASVYAGVCVNLSPISSVDGDHIRQCSGIRCYPLQHGLQMLAVRWLVIDDDGHDHLVSAIHCLLAVVAL
jgi:hypothetical protein